MFDKVGFLGKQINEFSLENYRKHKALFEVGYELNKFTYTTKNALSIDTNNGQQVIGSSLFSKIHNGFQAILILYRIGLDTEAKVILRTILEATFVLKAISDNEDEVSNFVNTDKRKQEKLLKSIFEKDKRNIYQDLRKSLSKDQLDSLKQEIKEEGIKDVEVYEWASKADMDVFYAYAYKTLNSEVHTDIRTLQKYLELDENKQDIIGINSLPSDKDIDRSLFTAYSLLVITLNCLNNVFDMGQEDVLKSLEEKIMSVRK
ncbi:DUF5677 domain-containing protein [Paenibacillus tyrfis]|uniref:DUF5677 domain-containing protein n=1 Tax=Paenibacillus tyrfis TaxID=1501230 RepID=UPI000B58B47B|nr:DUF5677 domain-containing protein [Paenibacillus tyrfis]